MLSRQFVSLIVVGVGCYVMGAAGIAGQPSARDFLAGEPGLRHGMLFIGFVLILWFGRRLHEKRPRAGGAGKPIGECVCCQASPVELNETQRPSDSGNVHMCDLCYRTPVGRDFLYGKDAAGEGRRLVAALNVVLEKLQAR